MKFYFKKKPKYFKPVSDLHNEFGCPFEFTPAPEDKDTMVLLLGDIDKLRYGNKVKESSLLIQFLKQLSDQFMGVVLVPGNHEHYSYLINRSVDKLRRFLGDNENVFVLEKDELYLGLKGDCRILGTTLWGDFNGGDFESMQASKAKMNDYRYIRYLHTLMTGRVVASKITPDYLFKENAKCKDFLHSTLGDGYAGKTLVLTHHAPSYDLLPEKYNLPQYEALHGSYASDMDDLLKDGRFSSWWFGHTHKAFQRELYGKLIGSNARGYLTPKENDTNPLFDPNLRLELKELFFDPEVVIKKERDVWMLGLES